ncbi:ovochymase-1 [Drosophila innubila]|uniref:ovochymase-1 n=1 Tax=Drosophila innubila TaxID=198719 RepID=UPI00148E043A|nr:ovochymase-1 [Drosophila innubila]
MRLQLICCVALASLLLHSSVKEVQLQPVLRVSVGKGGFFQWLQMILWTTTTTAPTTSTSTTEQTPENSIERECVSCQCGLINSLRKIVGGQETRRHQYPWLVAVLILGHFYCAGSLINDLYVLTAAHCVLGVPPELITLRFLEHNRSDSDPLVLERQAVHVKVHELYNPRSFDNDIALITLDKPVSFEGLIRPVCLPDSGSSFDGKMAFVAGWGARQEGGFATDTLQEVNVLVLSQSECRNSSYTPALISDNMLCAGYVDEDARDACSGDSGGPLHVLLDGQPGQCQVAGIVSWGKGCARPNTPGVYTRVNQYLHWIEASTPHACVCVPIPGEDY